MSESVASLPGRAFLLVIALLFAGVCADAQQQPDPPALQLNPELALRQFEAPANAEYELGRGDEITVDVVGRPEISGKHTVGPDGAITLPFVGSVKLIDKTREGSARAIEAALAKYYDSPSVSVGVDKYVSNTITLIGAVPHQGVLEFTKPPTLLEVLSRGGVGGTSETPIVLPEECQIYRENYAVLKVNLRELMRNQSTLANLRLKRDDIVVVPSAKDKYVSMMGEVFHPGNLALDSSSTLSQLLAQSGGITPKAGASPVINIIHPTGGKTELVAYKDVLSSKVLEYRLQSGDIIFVPQSGFNKIAYTIEKLSPALTLFTVGALFTH